MFQESFMQSVKLAHKKNTLAEKKVEMLTLWAGEMIPSGAPVPLPLAIRPFKQWASRNHISQNLTLGKEKADAWCQE